MIAVTTAITLIALAVGAWWWVTQPVLTTRPDPAAYIRRASAERLRRDVTTLATELGPRDEAHDADLAHVADFLEKRFAEHGKVQRQQFQAGGKRYSNVILRLGPAEGALVVVGAHYDTAGPYPGADDNASGVAGLIELARLLKEATLRTPVELVAFCLEEPPYFATAEMGSAIHARSLKTAGSQVRAMISLEMIGYFSDEKGSQRYPLDELRRIYPDVGNFIAVVGTPAEVGLVRTVKVAMTGATPLPVYSINAPRLLAGVDFSDHRSYLDEGYSAIMITDTAMFRNPYYHTAGDLPERLDFDRMAMVVDGTLAAVVALAG